MRRIGRRTRAGVTIVAVAAAALGSGAGAAAAQTTPTQPRTTVPTTSPAARSFPVLQSNEVPTGYRMSSTSPFHIDNRSPLYPTIDACLWDFDNPFSGLTPDIYQSSFQKSATTTGIAITIEFDAAKPATAFYDNFAEAYRAAAKCKMTKSTSSTTGKSVDYGTVELFDAGKLGDESFAVVITPSAAGFSEIKYATWRDGARVGSLRIMDPDMSTKEFKALAKVAAKRAS